MFAFHGSSGELGDNGYDFCGHETSGFQCSSECLGADSAQASLYRYPLRFSFRGRRQWAQPSKSADPVGPAGGEACRREYR